MLMGPEGRTLRPQEGEQLGSSRGPGPVRVGLTLGREAGGGQLHPPLASGSHLASDCAFACLGPRCLCPQGRMVQPHAHRPLHPGPTTEGLGLGLSLSPEGDHCLHVSRLTWKTPPPGSLPGLQLVPGEAANMLGRRTVWMQFLGRETQRQGLAGERCDQAQFSLWRQRRAVRR